jgi:hypothetical protein
MLDADCHSCAQSPAELDGLRLILAGLLTVPWLGLLSVLALPTGSQLQLMLGGAFVCFAIATAYAGIDLPSLGNFRWKQHWFLFGWLAPLVIGVLCLASWWAALPIQTATQRNGWQPRTAVGKSPGFS